MLHIIDPVYFRSTSGDTFETSRDLFSISVLHFYATCRPPVILIGQVLTQREKSQY